jgi:8-oxoguanine deaminase
MLDQGVAVGLGVDGSASNDSGNLLGEARQALLLSRVRELSRLMTARQALRMATRGGAAALRRDDVGSLAVGRQADVALFGLPEVAGAGFENDPVAALVLSSSPRARHVFVQGRPVVQDGALVNAEAARIAERHRAAVARIVA